MGIGALQPQRAAARRLPASPAPYGAWVDDGATDTCGSPPSTRIGSRTSTAPGRDGRRLTLGVGRALGLDVFTYGRWALSPVFGWVWVPGDVWGPAWVDWFSGDGFVGWAPLSPFGGVVVSNFVFVNEANFCDPQSEARGPGRESRAEARHRRPGRAPPPARSRAHRRVTHHPVRLEGKPHQTLAPWDRRGESLQPRSAGLRQPEESPPAIATAPLALESPAAGLDARGSAGPSTHRLGQPVLGRLSPAVPPFSVAVPSTPVRRAGLAPRRPTAPNGLRTCWWGFSAWHGVSSLPAQIHALACGVPAARRAPRRHAATVIEVSPAPQWLITPPPVASPR